MGKSRIAWTDRTWNPTTGCSPVSAGCQNCYAKRMAHRLAGRAGYPESPFEFDVTLQDHRLRYPYRWTKPSRVFVCSMSDLFHQDVPSAYIDAVFRVMKENPRHTFQVLTKRAERMSEYLRGDRLPGWPYPNVWVGVTVENAGESHRLFWLASTPAAVRWVSAEPLLGPLELAWVMDDYTGDTTMQHIDWVVAGAESGPGRRQMHEDWVRNLRDQCQLYGAAFFYKQAVVGRKMIHTPVLDGRTWEEYPVGR